jgi:TRAP-type C4-dicarboxylate transport system substrate-binding protein
MTIIEPNEEAFRKAVEPVYAKHGDKFGALLQAIRDTK